MSAEKLNNEGEGEIPQNNNNEPKNEASHEHIKDLNNSNKFNCLHVLIAFIIQLGLIIIAIIEFVIKKDCEIFNYLVDIFILFAFMFVIIYFISKKDNYLKGFVYYPFCSLFWAVGDLLSIFYIESSHDWDKSDTLKVTKLSLIVLSLIINISYMKFSNKNN